MRLAEIRERVRFACRASEDSFGDQDVDRAFKFAANELMRKARINRAEITRTLTANNPQIDTSIDDSGNATTFRPERLVLCEVGYDDNGTWTTATAYAVNDLVQGDGSPDSLYYVCTTAHTSDGTNEPPNTTYWTEVNWKQGTDVEQVAYQDVAEMHRGRFFLGSSGRRSAQLEGGVVGGVTDGRPRYIAWKRRDLAVVYPKPDLAYPLNLTYWLPLPEFTPGTKEEVDVQIPDEMVDGVIFLGTAAVLDNPEPAALSTEPLWRDYLAFIDQVRGEMRMNRRSVAWKNPGAYMG